ncbi:hypothetical protein [Streptomyces anandii]|uniref:hypothetical protein n=1 Tax=Streptomyces anandii TaxID=285454 RepID=UPI003798FD89
MIQPEAIPLFTGDLGELEHHIQALGQEADGIREAGSAAHRQFQQMSAFYQAPEAEELFASTAPARDAADTFADKVGTVADALSSYAAEVAPIAKRLEHLKSQATAFVAGLKTSSGDFDKDWNHDADKVAEHQALMHDVAAAQAAFTAAEVACANRITALVGGTQYVMHTSNKQLIPRGAEFYGYSAELLDQAGELPWGTPESQSHHFWDPHDFGHYFKSLVWDGFIVDGVWGTVDGLFSLVGANGPQSFKDSWGGIAHIVVGAETYLMESGGKKPTGVFATGFAQDSKAYAKEFAKSFVAWDQWKENPARAAGTVLFNFATLGAGPLKAASAGRVGTAAKVASSVARVGEAVDPVSAAVKVTGRGLPKIAELTNRLRATGDLPGLRTPHSTLELPDGSKLVIDDGRFLAYDKHGDLVADPPRQERSVTGGTSQEREPALTGAASQHTEAGARAGASPHEVPSSHGAGSGLHPTGDGSGGDAGHVPPPRNGSGAAGGDGVSHEGQAPGGHDPLERSREIMRQQVERANNDPRWFEDHYRSNGYRRSTGADGGYGQPIPQLVRNPLGSPKWIAISDMPPPIKEHYVHDVPHVGRRSDVHPDTLHHLDQQAAARDKAIALDKAAERKLAVAEQAYETSRTQDLADAMHRAEAEHSPLHGDMNRQSELFGEQVAELHAIPEHYVGAVRVDDGAFGNNRFDQIYRTPDGRYVVVEAKGSMQAKLGVRKGRSGRLVTQGTREYFETVLDEMENRAFRNEKKGLIESAHAERSLADQLRTALRTDKVDYVLVKADADGTHYAGYEMKKFNISK